MISSGSTFKKVRDSDEPEDEQEKEQQYPDTSRRERAGRTPRIGRDGSL